MKCEKNDDVRELGIYRWRIKLADLPSDIIWDDIFYKEESFRVCFKRLLIYIFLILVSGILIWYDQDYKKIGARGF
jgi:hypothetical protein